MGCCIQQNKGKLREEKKPTIELSNKGFLNVWFYCFLNESIQLPFLNNRSKSYTMHVVPTALN